MNKQNNIWYFGNNAGLDFNGTSPTVITSPVMQTHEGCASICDEASGLLLFYTDGITVWDSTHKVINPSQPLNGNSSSTSSAVIVPMPANSSMYYIFTVDYRHGDKGLQYSIVDASNPAAPVLTSMVNVKLVTPTSERLLAVRHTNCKDYWIITTNRLNKKSSNAFLVYKIESGTIAPIAQPFQNLGVTNLGIAGYLKASPKADKIALATYNDVNSVFAFDFNASTGVISNDQAIGPTSTSYGIEFSPNGNLLYFSNLGNGNGIGIGEVFQKELNNSNPAIKVGQVTNRGGYYAFGAMQLAPNGIIYIAKGGESELSAIKQPNNVGVSACDFQASEIKLNKGDTSRIGLPTLVQFQHCENHDCDCGCTGCNENAEEQNDELIDRAIEKHNHVPSDATCGKPFSKNCDIRAIQDDVNFKPCFYFHWGDGANDQIEEHDTEVFYLTVCNKFKDVKYNGLRVTKVTLTPSTHSIDKIHIVPDRFVNFDCLEACSCQTREFAMINRANDTAGNYMLHVEYCFDSISIASGISTSGKAEFPVIITED